MTAHGDLISQVRALLAQTMDVDVTQVVSGFDQLSCPAWGSLTHLMLISQLESRFGVVFSNQEIPELSSYDRIVDALTRKLGTSG